MFGLGLTMIAFGMAGIGGMGVYYIMDLKHKLAESTRTDRVNNTMNKIEQLLSDYKAQQELQTQFEEAAPEEITEESNIIDINDVFKEFESEEK